MLRGWAKIKSGAKYAGISERTFRGWLKDGLRHSRLKTGTVLVSFGAIDEYLARFEVSNNHADELIKEVMERM